MRQNLFWTVLISLMLLSIGGYTAHTLIKVWQYVYLNQHTHAVDIQWSIFPKNEESFIPVANYFFQVDEKNYHSQTLWQEHYLNRWAAEEAIMRLKKTAPLVWFNSHYPDKSSLQKIFPLKESLYSLLLWGLGIYFFALVYYVKRY